MYEIKCEDCKNVLFFDSNVTIESCLKDLDYSKDTIQDIQTKWLTNYLIYTCLHCKKSFKYTFREVEKKVRETISADVKNFRKVQMFRHIDHSLVNPDNGIEYCGQCDGMDNKGNCLVDIIKQCTIRHES